MLSQDEMKQRVAREAAGLVADNSITGIGSGSTIAFFIEALAQRVQEGLRCLAIPTSQSTQQLAGSYGIPIAALQDTDHIDLAIDGADEIDGQLRLLKGGGGALLQEKMVAAAARERIIIADSSKFKKILGQFPLPVEVIPYGWKQVRQQIQHRYGIEPVLRMTGNQPFITDHGHHILDCPFEAIADPADLNIALHLLPGVVETGLFIDLCEKALIGQPDGSIIVLSKKE